MLRDVKQHRNGGKGLFLPVFQSSNDKAASWKDQENMFNWSVCLVFAQRAIHLESVGLIGIFCINLMILATFPKHCTSLRYIYIYK